MWAVDVFVLGEANFFAALTMGGASIFPCESSAHIMFRLLKQWLLEESRKEIMARKIIAADGSVYVKKKPFYLRWWFIALVIIVLLGGCASMMGGGSKSSTTVSAPSSSAVVDSSAPSASSDAVGTDTSSAADTGTSYYRCGGI